jgi:hypothetical protein
MSAAPFSGGTSRPIWRELYERAILELDNTKAPERIAEAHHAIRDRAGETLIDSSSDERRALNNALRTLGLILFSLSLPQVRTGAQPILQSADSLEVPMTGETRKRWMEFCEQAAIEQDPNKLIALVEEINRLLQEKQDRIHGRNPASIPDAG